MHLLTSNYSELFVYQAKFCGSGTYSPSILPFSLYRGRKRRLKRRGRRLARLERRVQRVKECRGRQRRAGNMRSPRYVVFPPF